MTTKELREAAERAEYLAGSPTKLISFAEGGGAFVRPEHLAAIHAVAAHILATTQEDDDEPLTEEWVAQAKRRHYKEWPCHGMFGLGGGRVEIVTHATGHRMRTRGEVRNLLRAVGINP